MKHGNRGFTLIELLLVISIIGVLTSVILPSVNGARDKALVASTVLEIGTLKTVFEQLYDDTGKYPNALASLCRTTLPADNEVDLSTDNAGLLANGEGWTGWAGPYVPDVEDAWGNPYYLDEDYQCLAATEGCRGLTDAGNDSSVIVSCGPNGTISGTSCAYDADNIVYRLCN